MRISPRDCTVAIKLRPVALQVVSRRIQMNRASTYVPGRSSIVGLRHIVVSLAMSSNVKDLVIDVGITGSIESLDLVLKPLPLRLGAGWVICRVSIVSLVDQTEVGCSLGA